MMPKGGLGERISAEEFVEVARLPVRLVLDNLRSGQNVGACFRSADAFRIDGLDLCGITCLPPHRDILKSALGSSDHVPWRAHEQTVDAVASLQSEGWKVAAVEQAPGSVSLDQWCPNTKEKWALVLGNEVRGVSSDVLAMVDAVIEMPQYGVKQSINVSVCAGVYLWHASSCLRGQSR